METTTATPILAMEKGTYVRVKETGATGDQRYRDKIATISDALPTSDNRIWVKFLSQYSSIGTHEELVHVADLEVMPDQAAAPHQQELEAWRSRYYHQADRIEKYQIGVDKLGEYAMEIADLNNYCNEYDEVVESVNQRLDSAGYGLVQLPTRSKEFEVTVNIRAQVWTSTTVTVEARDEDTALSMVQDDPESYISDLTYLLSEAMSYNDPDIDYDCELG